MAVYVDSVRFKYRGMVMCHMWADTEAELHRMAGRIGMSREWHQAPPTASWSHYDVSLSRKKMAQSLGAILTDRFGALEHVARLKGDTELLDRIQKRRARRLLTAV
jgi:hypothetical protein